MNILEESRGITIPNFAGRDKYDRRLWTISYKQEGKWKTDTFIEYDAAYNFYINYLNKSKQR